MTKLFLVVALFSLITISCSNEKTDEAQSLSIEDIQQKQGIPVRVKGVEKSSFEVWKDYSAVLEGYRETKVVPMLNDRLAKLNVEVGDFVRKGQIIAIFDKNHPQARYNQAKVHYQTIKNTYERMKSVKEAGGISQQQFEEVEAQFLVAQKNYNTVKDMIYVKAPISGVVTNVFVNENTFIDPHTDVICQISSLDRLRARIFVEERNISQFKKGQPVRVTWDAYPDKEFSGVIETISLSATPQVRGFSVEVVINNPDKTLRPGIFANIYIRTTQKDSVILVSRHSIITEDNKSFVYLAKGSQAVKTEVETGFTSGTTVEITNGLNVGDTLISEGLSLLSDNALVNIVD